MCDIPLIKCTLDKIPERSKIITNFSTLFSINLLSIKCREKSKILLKVIIIIVVIVINKNDLYYAFVHVHG